MDHSQPEPKKKPQHLCLEEYNFSGHSTKSNTSSNSSNSRTKRGKSTSKSKRQNKLSSVNNAGPLYNGGRTTSTTNDNGSTRSSPAPSTTTGDGPSTTNATTTLIRINDKLSWKSDPVASFSDFKIEIERSESGFIDSYNVHRNIVAFGPRRSTFLTRYFQEHRNKNSCRLVFETPKANVFPMLLDFMYSTREERHTLTAERACAMFTLAEFFGISSLQKAVTDFYRKNLNMSNMAEFLGSAAQFKVDTLLLVTKAKIGVLITEKPELAGLVPPHFLADIFEIRQQQMNEILKQDPTKFPKEWQVSQSRHLSKAAYGCALRHEQGMTLELFLRLTSSDYLPNIDPSVSLKLLLLDLKFHQNDKNNGSGGDGGGGGELSNLQQRCIDAMFVDWEFFQNSFSSPDALSDALKKLPSNVLADILLRSMSQTSLSPKNANGQNGIKKGMTDKLDSVHKNDIEGEGANNKDGADDDDDDDDDDDSDEDEEEG